MFIVTEEGIKIEVQHPEIGEDEFMSGIQNVGLYADDITLKPIWIVQLQKYNDFRIKAAFVGELNLNLLKKSNITINHLRKKSYGHVIQWINSI